MSNKKGDLNDGPKSLVVIPGLVFITVMLWFFTHISVASSVALIVAMHIGLMIGSSMVVMPSQTNGLNQLPPELYPHGTAVMNTLQQATGAIGTAVSISVLSSGINSYLHNSHAPSKPPELVKAMTMGAHNVFLFAMIIALIGLVTSLFIRRGQNQAELSSAH